MEILMSANYFSKYIFFQEVSKLNRNIKLYCKCFFLFFELQSDFSLPLSEMKRNLKIIEFIEHHFVMMRCLECIKDVLLGMSGNHGGLLLRLRISLKCIKKYQRQINEEISIKIRIFLFKFWKF
jgi:hypothetical protein